MPLDAFTHGLTLIAQIFVLDLVLSGDNAIAIALVCRALPRREMNRAILVGTVAAIVLRVVLASMVSLLLALPLLKLVGAAALIVIAISLLDEETAGGGAGARARGAAPNLQAAITAIIGADLVMSVDNVVALAAVVHGQLLYLAFGVLLSVPLLMYGSRLLIALLQREPLLVPACGALLGYVAGDIATSDPLLRDWIDTQSPALHVVMPVLCAVYVVVQSRIIARQRRLVGRPVWPPLWPQRNAAPFAAPASGAMGAAAVGPVAAMGPVAADGGHAISDVSHYANDATVDGAADAAARVSTAAPRAAGEAAGLAGSVSEVQADDLVATPTVSAMPESTLPAARVDAAPITDDEASESPDERGRLDEQGHGAPPLESVAVPKSDPAFPAPSLQAQPIQSLPSAQPVALRPTPATAPTNSASEAGVTPASDAGRPPRSPSTPPSRRVLQPLHFGLIALGGGLFLAACYWLASTRLPTVSATQPASAAPVATAASALDVAYLCPEGDITVMYHHGASVIRLLTSQGEFTGRVDSTNRITWTNPATDFARLHIGAPEKVENDARSVRLTGHDLGALRCVRQK